LPFLEALCSFSPADDGTWAAEESSGPGTRKGAAMVPVMLGTGATEGSSGGGTAGGARTGAGGVVAMVSVWLGTGATGGSSDGGAAGTRTGARDVVVIPVMVGTGATVMVRLGMPVKGTGAWGSAESEGKWAWVCPGPFMGEPNSSEISVEIIKKQFYLVVWVDHFPFH
jgi:hypothetical protein